MPIVTLAPFATSLCSGGMPTGFSSAARNAAGASGNGGADGGGPGGMRVRSTGRWAGCLVVPQVTRNSWVRDISRTPLFISRGRVAVRESALQWDRQSIDSGDDRTVEDVPDELEERGEPGLAVLGVGILPRWMA